MPHFCSVWGPFKTRHRKREFSGISYSGGGGEFFDFRTGIPGDPGAKEKENSDHKLRGRKGETTSAISQDRIFIRISRTCSQQTTKERERRECDIVDSVGYFI